MEKNFVACAGVGVSSIPIQRKARGGGVSLQNPSPERDGEKQMSYFLCRGIAGSEGGIVVLHRGTLQGCRK